jgi:hypothetical protein
MKFAANGCGSFAMRERSSHQLERCGHVSLGDIRLWTGNSLGFGRATVSVASQRAVWHLVGVAVVGGDAIGLLLEGDVVGMAKITALGATEAVRGTAKIHLPSQWGGIAPHPESSC